MDHTLYDYSALPTRAPLHWADGTGLAAFAVLFLEHWEFMPPPDALRDPRMVGEFGSFTPDYRSWSQREYGLRIGIFRVIDALRQAGVRPAVAANAMAVRRLPRLVELFNDWGCEWIAHGEAATRMLHSGMPLAEQRRHVVDAMSTIEDATGHRPTGWLGQDWGSTPDTPALLAEAGLRYTLDWSNDDQPYWMHTTPPLLSIPLSSEWDDVQCQWLRHMEPRAHAELAATAFARLHTEAAKHRRAAVFGLPLHPWLSGMPSRIRALHELLARLRSHPGVAWTTPGALFDQVPGR
ncbi:MAG: polysaccharide deacetylase [Rhodoferax sp.]|nr:polysaccharide deacetylase [Rhodoferax sp.]